MYMSWLHNEEGNIETQVFLTLGFQDSALSSQHEALFSNSFSMSNEMSQLQTQFPDSVTGIFEAGSTASDSFATFQTWSDLKWV
jgi:hypothetical protein